MHSGISSVCAFWAQIELRSTILFIVKVSLNYVQIVCWGWLPPLSVLIFTFLCLASCGQESNKER